MQEWYLGWEKVSCLCMYICIRRCPQFSSNVLSSGSLYTGVPIYVYSLYVMTPLMCSLLHKPLMSRVILDFV